MDPKLVGKLILYLVNRLGDIEAPISSIRLIKYLYLIDYEHFRKYSSTFTCINWIRYKYGPYFMDFPAEIKKLRIDLEPIEVDNDCHKAVTYRSFEQIELDELPFYKVALINNIIQMWAFEDLKNLLDYVYQTEPMKVAKINEKLDFSILCKYSNTNSIKKEILLSPEISAKIKDKLQENLIKQTSVNVSSYFDEAYFNAMRVMDSEDISQLILGGKVRTNFYCEDDELNHTE